MIVYDELFARLKREGIAPTVYLRNNGFHAGTVDKLRKNQTVTTETLNNICALLDCQPGDFLRYVEDQTAEKE